MSPTFTRYNTFKKYIRSLFTNANVPTNLDKKVIDVSKEGIISKLVATEVFDKALPLL